ncbi:LysR family transcriptional regulator [Clostridium magnum]|uniref:LysR family transcriptional regulator n=1 Tax=Clostridium magnum TaxID=33954 RepID=UPI0031192629
MNFSKVAEQLGYSQSAVTIQIKQLEYVIILLSYMISEYFVTTVFRLRSIKHKFITIFFFKSTLQI